MVCILCIDKANISVLTSNVLGAVLFDVIISLLED